MKPATVRFTEVMTGTISGARVGANTSLALRLTVDVANLERFLAEPDHTARLSGWVDCPAMGGRLPVEHGTCSFFPQGPRGRETGLGYWLTFTDGAGKPWTLRGEKRLRTGAPGRLWVDTTTLYIRLLPGQLEANESNGQEGSVAEGVLRITPLAFVKQLTTFRSEGHSAAARARALVRYLAFFSGGIWTAYIADARPHREVRARGEYR